MPDHDVLLADGLPVETLPAVRDETGARPPWSAASWREARCRAPLIVRGPELAHARRMALA
jgi:hypothetical protein